MSEWKEIQELLLATTNRRKKKEDIVRACQFAKRHFSNFSPNYFINFDPREKGYALFSRDCPVMKWTFFTILVPFLSQAYLDEQGRVDPKRLAETIEYYIFESEEQLTKDYFKLNERCRHPEHKQNSCLPDMIEWIGDIQKQNNECELLPRNHNSSWKSLRTRQLRPL